jgi:GAF domain-containing protein
MVCAKLWVYPSYPQNPRVVAGVKAILSESDGSVNAMVEEVIRTKAPVIANDSQNDSRVVFREKHAEFGYGSMVVLPLIVADEVTGVLALYAREEQFFHEEEMNLLTELAGDIGFAIDHIDTREHLALHRAIADYLGWLRAGLADVRIAVNVSPQQLRHRDFVADIKLALGIDPKATAGLELEITESMVMQDFKHKYCQPARRSSLGSLRSHRRLWHRLLLTQLPVWT